MRYANPPPASRSHAGHRPASATVRCGGAARFVALAAALSAALPNHGLAQESERRLRIADVRPDPEGLQRRWDIDGDDRPRIEWNPDWGRASAVDYALIGASLISVVAFQIIGPLHRTDPWNEVGPADQWLRDAVGSQNEEQRGRMRDASDLLLSAVVSYPFLFDGLVTTLWYHDSPAAGRELALLSLEAQFVTSVVQSFANMVGSRQRPYVDRCESGDLSPENGDCTGGIQYRSFFSGHTSQAFAAAGTTCVFHARLPLYGGTAWDGLACGGAMAVAATVGFLRITADMHYLSDVVVGAIAGTGIGVILPLLRMRRAPGVRERTVSIVPNGLGVALLGELR
ncbi:MAG: phosphatase PAP2 family protein [Myxococcota bacterium]